MAYDDFVAAGSLAAAREKGLVSWLHYHEHLASYKYFHWNSYMLHYFFSLVENQIHRHLDYLSRRIYIRFISYWRLLILLGYSMIHIWNFLIVRSYNIEINFSNVTSILGWGNMCIQMDWYLDIFYWKIGMYQCFTRRVRWLLSL